MASVTPRASAFWSINDDNDDDEVGLADMGDDEESQGCDGRTPLDRTIDKIGMGTYQWTLLSLCGLGWLADNMWIEAVSIILPRVQRHFSVPDGYIGTLSSSMFAGMMIGAVGWGTCSDLIGRIAAFNATLCFTALFGVLAAFANSFPVLCILLFFLGTAVGGSMPTDGTLILEHMPHGKRHLLTALSVFFSFGAVLAAAVGLVTLVRHSCPPLPAPCQVDTENQGWKYMLAVLGGITLAMFLARVVFFRLHESPRFLVHAGRPHDAVHALRMISRFNGEQFTIRLGDVEDDRPAASCPPPEDEDEQDARTWRPGGVTGRGRHPIPNFQESSAADDEHAQPLLLPARSASPEPLRDPDSAPEADAGVYVEEDVDAKHYHATRETHLALEQPLLPPPHADPRASTRRSSPTSTSPPEDPPARPRPRIPRTGHESMSRATLLRRSDSGVRMPQRGEKGRGRGAGGEDEEGVMGALRAWSSRVAMVLTPEWARTTLLVWAAWFGMSLAFTMFNVFLPKLLETPAVSSSYRPPSFPLSSWADPAPIGQPSGARALNGNLWDIVAITLGGCPGAIVGAYLVDSPLGRRRSLAGAAFLNAALCVLFAGVRSAWLVRLVTIGLSLSVTVMYAVLYSWTPQIFGTKVRGTACGIASALSRVGGMIAPLVGGALLTVDRAFPVYASAVVFALSGVCVVMLREDAGEGEGDGGMMH